MGITWFEVRGQEPLSGPDLMWKWAEPRWHHPLLFKPRVCLCCRRLPEFLVWLVLGYFDVRSSTEGCHLSIKPPVIATPITNWSISLENLAKPILHLHWCDLEPEIDLPSSCCTVSKKQRTLEKSWNITISFVRKKSKTWKKTYGSKVVVRKSTLLCLFACSWLCVSVK